MDIDRWRVGGRGLYRNKALVYKVPEAGEGRCLITWRALIPWCTGHKRVGLCFRLGQTIGPQDLGPGVDSKGPGNLSRGVTWYNICLYKIVLVHVLKLDSKPMSGNRVSIGAFCCAQESANGGLGGSEYRHIPNYIYILLTTFTITFWR